MSSINVKDFRLVSRALRERWQMPDKVREKALEVCKEILNKQDASVDDKLKAMGRLLEADRLNLKHEELFTPKIDITMDLAGRSEEEILKEIERLEESLKEEPPKVELVTQSQVEIEATRDYVARIAARKADTTTGA